MLFRQIREYFIFTRRERNGLLVLVFVLVMALSADFVIPYLVPGKVTDLSGVKSEADAYFSQRQPVIPQEEIPFKGVIDPNNVSREELRKLGVTHGVAENWIRYIQKGGRFSRKEEVRKLYGMSDDMYDKISVHLGIVIQSRIMKTNPVHYIRDNSALKGNSPQVKMTEGGSVSNRVTVFVEINMADSVQLESLPGIGPVLASRILKYRNLLGGFYDVEQLMDTYGMTRELWLKASPLISVDTSVIKTRNINFMTLNELGRHPYIGFRAARKIVRQRDLHGKYTRREELEPFFPGDSLRRLWPYITTGDNEF